MSAMSELEQLVDDLGRRSFEARVGSRGLPDSFDEALWRNLEETGLSRLTSAEDAGPAEAAIVLTGLAKHAARGADRRDRPARSLARGDGRCRGARHRAADGRDRRRRRAATAGSPDRPRCAVAAATVVLAARTPDELHVAIADAGRHRRRPRSGRASRAAPSRSTWRVDDFASVDASGRRRAGPPRRVGALCADHRRA